MNGKRIIKFSLSAGPGLACRDREGTATRPSDSPDYVALHDYMDSDRQKLQKMAKTRHFVTIWS